MRSHWLVPRRSARSVLPTLGDMRPFLGIGDFDRFLDQVWSGLSGTPARGADFAPRVDIGESDGEYRITVELPGLEEKDFEVSLEGDVLTIKGQKRTEREEKREGFYHVESSSGLFERSFQLPEGVDPESVKASYKNGLLTVTVPKPAEVSRARTIPVTAS